MKIKLHTAPINGGPFNCAPAGEWELNDEDVLCNNIILPGEFNPHNVRLWVIGHEFGPFCAVWADCEQDALDEATDAGKLDAQLISEEDFAAMSQEEQDDCARLGNAGEPANLDNVWLRTVVFEPARDWQVMCKFAEARGAGQNTLDN